MAILSETLKRMLNALAYADAGNTCQPTPESGLTLNARDRVSNSRRLSLSRPLSLACCLAPAGPRQQVAPVWAASWLPQHHEIMSVRQLRGA